MNPPNKVSHLRLWLYIISNTLPAVIKWLTLTFDISPRGLAILAAETLLTGCITTRAYLDGKTTNKVPDVGNPPQVQPIIVKAP